MNVAVVDVHNNIIAINVHSDNYILGLREIQVVNTAYVGGFVVDGKFIPPQPYPSWVLDEDTCLWQPPTPYPNDGGMYQWDEVTGDWVATE